MPLFELLRWCVNISYDPVYDSAGSSTSIASVKIKVNGQTVHIADEGVGPVDALNKALKKALSDFYQEIEEIVLFNYMVHIEDSNQGTEAKVKVIIEMKKGENRAIKVSSSDNILEASWNALVDGFEELVERRM